MPQLSRIPKVDSLLAHPAADAWLRTYRRPLLLRAIRAVLDDLRGELRAGAGIPALPVIIERISTALQRLDTPHLHRVVNGTGTVINTNLGRSPLPQRVASQLLEITTH